MNNPVTDILFKIRVLFRRRRSKYSLVVLVIFIYLLFVIFFYGGYASNTEQPTTSGGNVINENGSSQKGWLDWLYLKKTIPFMHTVGNSASKGNSGPPKVVVSSEDLRRSKIRMLNELHKKHIESNKNEAERLKTGYEFYNHVFELMEQGKPKVEKLDRYPSKERIYHARYNTKDPEPDEIVFSEKYLSSFLQLTPEELTAMKQSHKYMVDNLPLHAPKGLYKGSGIVFVGGGAFNWLTLLSIKSLRSLGCQMPIEVFIPKIDEFELDFCGKMLPALQARCIYMRHQLIDPDLSNSDQDNFAGRFKFNGYQFKVLAMLLSSFENVLLLDSDNIPAHRPDQLFDSEPFTSNGLIVWPDFWRRATSPHYYTIADLPISKTELLPKYNEVLGFYDALETKVTKPLDETPLHERKGAIPETSSESGQVMISKKTHFKALLLALYYNIYGPTHYYPLFSQGSDGEGDKETFLAATVALGNKYYQVATFLNALGYFTDKGFQGHGMGQFDPTEDYQYNLRRAELSKLETEDEKQSFINKNPILSTGPRMLFVHANFPKLNPWVLYAEKKIFGPNGKRIRLYGPSMRKKIGYDFEWVQWNNMKLVLCVYGIKLEIFNGVDKNALCAELNQHLNFLKETIGGSE